MPCASPGIFYRDEIAQEFSTRMKFWSMMRNRSWCLQPGCPLWMMMSPGLVQGFWWQSTSLCSSQDVSPHPYKATTELELCLPLSPARGLVSPRGGRAGGSTGQRRDPKRGCGARSPVGGTHFWDDLQPFLGCEESLRDPGGFGGHFGGSQGHWMIPEDWSILWENWRDPGS